MSDTDVPRPDWPTQVTDFIVRTVDRVRASTTDRALGVVKLVVAGVFALIVGLLIGMLALIGLFRAADRARELVVADSVWLTYLVLGVVFVLVGQVLFSRRKKAF